MVKIVFSTLIACFGIFGISAACTISPDAGWQYSFADKSCDIPPAILTVKRVVDSGDHFKDFMKEWDKDIRYMAVPTNAQRAEYNAIYTSLVSTIWFEQNRKSASKLGSTLQGLLEDMRSKYKDQSLTFEERTKFAYLYFLNFVTVEALRGTSDVIKHDTSTDNSNVYNPTGPGLTLIESYTTLNGTNYGLRQGSIFYVFSRGDSNQVNTARRSRSLDELINYLEYQNRIILKAPNGRKYAIRKFNNTVKVNRDNGTIIPADFASYDAAAYMVNTCAVNTVVAPQDRPICNFNTYGRK